jgi:hypothetical protein
MLANPDIAPSASINQWIVTILTFHFDLVHVVGTHHGPNGLSRRPRQDGDKEEIDDEEDFKDWINHLHRFMHQINVVIPHSPSLTQLSTFTLSTDSSEEDSISVDNNIDSYKLIL